MRRASATNTVSSDPLPVQSAATVPQLYTIRCVFWNYARPETCRLLFRRINERFLVYRYILYEGSAMSI